MKIYRIFHKPTQKFIWYEKHDYGFSNGLVSDEHREPIEFENADSALCVMCKTTFGIDNLKLTEFDTCKKGDI